MKVQTNTFFTLRERTTWEACDAGLLLWRGNIVRILGLFSLPLIILVAIGEFIPVGIDIVFFFAVVWWLKPFFDRFALHIVQARFFNQDISGKKLFKGLAKNIFRALLGDLLWRRFSPRRAAIMPLRILESLKGSKLKKRKQSLDRGGIKFCVILTILCAILEIVLWCGEILFLYLLDELFDINLLAPGGNHSRFWNVYILYLINYIIVETIYVCAGFSLYINARIIVEGWDLQLQLSSNPHDADMAQEENKNNKENENNENKK